MSAVLPGNGPTEDSRRLTAALFAGGIATFGELYAVQAVLPALADEWQLTESTASLAISVATGALAVSVLPWAAAADRIGRARAMTISAVIAAVAGALAPLAPSFAVLLVLRAIAGLALGAVPALAMAHLVAKAPPGRVSAIGGLYIAGTTIGGLLGRVLTGAVSGFAGWRWGLATTALLQQRRIDPGERLGAEESAGRRQRRRMCGSDDRSTTQQRSQVLRVLAPQHRNQRRVAGRQRPDGRLGDRLPALAPVRCRLARLDR